MSKREQIEKILQDEAGLQTKYFKILIDRVLALDDDIRTATLDEVKAMKTKTIDKLYLELSQFTQAKTERELFLESKIREICTSKSWEEQCVMAELALADIEDRMPDNFALKWLEDA